MNPSTRAGPGLRIGHGYDTHRLEAGDGVQLGGVFIACEYRIVAHSDGDALIHALCDALLGAIAGGDIGKLFPDHDPQYKGIDSRRLLDEVMRRVRDAGYRVANADLTLIAQAPRVSAHTAAMCAQLADGLGVAIDRVNVKATTNEGMDAIGARQGLAAHAVVLLEAA
ncbi:MAG TPA: 2-C-methyl-D-erythritol 2,4-cyclodiphosphate synthase [Solimonas sp.]